TVAPHWTDAVYVSLKSTLDGTAIKLGEYDNQSALGPAGTPDDSYHTTTGPLTIPLSFGGPAFLIVPPNADRAAHALPNATNNTPARPTTVTPTPPADLVTSLVASADQAFIGSTITVQYTVTNKGLGPTDVPDWVDTIWLSHGKDRPDPRKPRLDVLLGT